MQTIHNKGWATQSHVLRCEDPRSAFAPSWATIVGLHDEVGKAIRAACEANDTDEMLQRLKTLSNARLAHREALEAWKEAIVVRTRKTKRRRALLGWLRRPSYA